MTRAQLLTNQVRTYDWGSRTVLPALVGAPVPSVQPWAEIWIGAHPVDPSRLADGRSLADLEPGLGFMVKLLAAEFPLSIQAHPDREHAAAGYAAEEALGVPRSSASRSFKDTSHKPELLVALTRFEALCGFRSPTEILRLAASWGAPRWVALVEPLRGDPASGAALRACFARLVQLPEPDCEALLAEVVATAAAFAEDPLSAHRDVARWVVELARLHPDDPGVAAPLLLRLVILAPGEGLFVAAGVLHSYLHGAGVEVQASSDNVLRAGLTAKKVDLPELLSVIVADQGPAPLVRPRALAAGLDTYDVPVEDFAVWRVRPAGKPIEIAASGPVIVVCVDGAVAVEGQALTPGAAAYLPADLTTVTIGGAGTCFVTARRAAAPG